MYDPYTSTHTIIRVTVKKRHHLTPRFAKCQLVCQKCIEPLSQVSDDLPSVRWFARNVLNVLLKVSDDLPSVRWFARNVLNLFLMCQMICKVSDGLPEMF